MPVVARSLPHVSTVTNSTIIFPPLVVHSKVDFSLGLSLATRPLHGMFLP